MHREALNHYNHRLETALANVSIMAFLSLCNLCIWNIYFIIVTLMYMYMYMFIVANLETNDRIPYHFLNLRCETINPGYYPQRGMGDRWTPSLEQMNSGNSWLCMAQLANHHRNISLELAHMVFFYSTLNLLDFNTNSHIMAGWAAWESEHLRVLGDIS